MVSTNENQGVILCQPLNICYMSLICTIHNKDHDYFNNNIFNCFVREMFYTTFDLTNSMCKLERKLDNRSYGGLRGGRFNYMMEYVVSDDFINIT